MTAKISGLSGCLFCVGNSDSVTIGGTEMIREWLRFCLTSVPNDVFSLKIFVSDRPDLLKIAAESDWMPIETSASEWDVAAIMRKTVPLFSNCDRFAYLSGTNSFPKTSSWTAALETVFKYPRNIILMSHHGRRRYPFFFPKEFYSELASISENNTINAVLSWHPVRIRLVESVDWYDTSNIPIIPVIPIHDPAKHLRESVHPVLSVRLFTDEKCFGPGIAELLSLVESLGSLRAAATEMGMSYTKAWNIVRHSEQALHFKLMKGTSGGAKGGGAILTHEAKQLIILQRDYSEKINSFAERLLQQEMERYFPQPDDQHLKER